MSALPIVKYRGKEWYLDERLREMRNVKNPHDRREIPLRFRTFDTVGLSG